MGIRELFAPETGNRVEWSARRRVIRDAVRELLIAIGEDPTREGLQDTPDRVARFWEEFIGYDPGKMAVFADEAHGDDLVALKGMELWSLCEHHMLPFSVNISVGYLPNGKVLGLSKFARIAQRSAHRLQVQERLTRDIANDIVNIAGTQDVAVIARGVHTCMSMRGVRTPAVTHTSVMLGKFRESASLRAELLTLLGEG